MNRYVSVLVLCIACFTQSQVYAAAKNGQPVFNASSGQSQLVTVAKRKNRPVDLLAKTAKNSGSVEFSSAGAKFIKVHFKHFRLPPKWVVEVSNLAGTESYLYSMDNKDSYTYDRRLGDDGKHSFSSMSITGDTAIVRILSRQGSLNSLKHKLEIDYFMEGVAEDYGSEADASNGGFQGLEASSQGGKSKLQSTCGVAERYDAICWADSHPDAYVNSAPVAKLLVGGARVCSAWRVGENNHLFTNNHCIKTQDDVTSSELWFDYDMKTCGGWDNYEPVKVSGNTLLATDYTLDFSLFTINDFASVEPFGFLGIDVHEVEVGEEIYIPQHGYGQPKQITIESDMNTNGWCQIDDANHDGKGVATDLGYYCDTVGGSSGSPVLSLDSNRVLALHHSGGCLNSGVKMSLIWPVVSSHFGGIIPDDDGLPSENQSPTAVLDVSCDELLCSFDGSGSSDPDGAIVDYTWNTGDGHLRFGELVSHQYAEPGNYSVRLTVADNKGATHSQITTIVVENSNQLPVATFSVSCTELECLFDASASGDPDGQVNQYSWDFGDASVYIGSETNVSHGYSAAGQFEVALVVTDNDGGSSAALTTIEVSQSDTVNLAPTAEFTVNCQDWSCTLDGSASQDPDGSIQNYNWDFGDGAAQTSVVSQVVHDYTGHGDFLVRLTVEDDMGASASFDLMVTLYPLNLAPSAEFSFECSGLICDFDGSSSEDPEGEALDHVWNFGDGTFGSGISPTHHFEQAGTYTVSLTVSDSQESSTQISKAIEVQPDDVTGVSLEVDAGKTRGDKYALLRWSGLQADFVEIHRDGEIAYSVPNSGEYLDLDVSKRAKSVSYRVCENQAATCTDLVAAEW